MNDTMHDQLRDRMPDVAHGTTTWTAEEAGHLATCAECRAEWTLVQATRRLGTAVEAGWDGAKSAEAVLGRLRTAPAATRSRYRPVLLLATAAALALMFARPVTPPNAAPPSAEVGFIPELDSLSVEELTLVAEAFDGPLTETTLIDGQPAADLDTTQLQRVLRALEG